MSVVPDRWTRHVLGWLRAHQRTMQHQVQSAIVAAPQVQHSIRYRAGCDIDGCTEIAVWEARLLPVFPTGSNVVFAVNCPRHPQEPPQ